MIFNVYLAAKSGDRRKIGIVSHIESNGDDLKPFWEEIRQLPKDAQKRERIFPPGNADRDLVAVFYHIVVFHTSAYKGKQFLQKASLLFMIIKALNNCYNKKLAKKFKLTLKKMRANKRKTSKYKVFKYINQNKRKKH